MKKLKISNRLQSVPASPIRKLVPFAARAEKQGVKVYYLNIGDPDIKTPEVMLEVLRNWRQNPIPYGQSQGQPNLLKALQIYYNRLGFTFINQPSIQITTGGSEAISMAICATANPGDEIITFEPFYANYNSFAAVNSVKIKSIATSALNGFHLPPMSSIESKITKKTKAILICNPNNPTGTVYTKSEIEMLIEIAKKNNLYLIADEVYRDLAYDGRKPVTLLFYMKKLPQHLIVIDSLSKRYSLCGARVGALISLNHEIMAGILRIAQGRLSTGFIDQAVASKLTSVSSPYLTTVYKEFEKRRNVLYEGLKTISGVIIPRPEGAFYTIVTLPVKSSENFCRWLLTDFRLDNETVMLAPAAGFYASVGLGINQVRIAYVLNIASLKKSIKIIKTALQQYKE